MFGGIEKNLDTERKFGTVRYIAIDFDGTITEPSIFPTIGNLKSGVIEVLDEFRKNGIAVIVWTCRTGEAKERMKLFLEDNQVPFDFINENPFCPQANEKVFADVYIDDRGYSFNTWDTVIQDIEELGRNLPRHIIRDPDGNELHPQTDTSGNVKIQMKIPDGGAVVCECCGRGTNKPIEVWRRGVLTDTVCDLCINQF